MQSKNHNGIWQELVMMLIMTLNDDSIGIRDWQSVALRLRAHARLLTKTNLTTFSSNNPRVTSHPKFSVTCRDVY